MSKPAKMIDAACDWHDCRVAPQNAQLCDGINLAGSRMAWARFGNASTFTSACKTFTMASPCNLPHNTFAHSSAQLFVCLSAISHKIKGPDNPTCQFFPMITKQMWKWDGKGRKERRWCKTGWVKELCVTVFCVCVYKFVCVRVVCDKVVCKILRVKEMYVTNMCVKELCVWKRCVWQSRVWKSCVWQNCVWKGCVTKLCVEGICDKVVWKSLCDKVVCDKIVCERNVRQSCVWKLCVWQSGVCACVWQKPPEPD